jgi:hypothetical protein
MSPSLPENGFERNNDGGWVWVRVNHLTTEDGYCISPWKPCLSMAVELIHIVSIRRAAAVIDRKAFDITTEPMVYLSYFPGAQFGWSQPDKKDLSCFVSD